MEYSNYLDLSLMRHVTITNVHSLINVYDSALSQFDGALKSAIMA